MVATFGRHSVLLILLIWSLGLSTRNCCIGLLEIYEKECQGTSMALSTSGIDQDKRYEEYRKEYENCTLIRDNLEIVSLQITGAQYDFSFLETIREVNGYVLIYQNHVDRIRLTGLRVIRGEKTFSKTVNGTKKKFSLFVGWNDKASDQSTGLKELQLTSLVEITNGDVYFDGNLQLCFGEETIDWKYINLNNPKGEIIINSTGKQRECSTTCHKNCSLGGGTFCWAERQDMCQAERPCKDCRRGCSTIECSCHPECIGGCTESDPSSCVACKNFLRGDECVENCSSARYNRDTKQWEDPPITYMLDRKCVSECPENMLMHNGACVTKCNDGFIEDKTSNECVPCQGACPKTCNGTGDTWLHSNNLAQFNQCTLVDGHLSINNNSFNGHSKFPKIQLADLKILNDIREITGKLVVQAWHSGLASLSYLGNLRTIGGNGAEPPYALVIRSTALQALNLTSLKQIRTGGVYITQNSELCYVYTINWTRISTSKENNQKIVVKENANSAACTNQGRICSGQCSDLGCWGPGDENCVRDL